MKLEIIYSLWGLGIGDWGFGPTPNPQSPIKIDNHIFIEITIY